MLEGLCRQFEGYSGDRVYPSVLLTVFGGLLCWDRRDTCQGRQGGVSGKAWCWRRSGVVVREGQGCMGGDRDVKKSGSSSREGAMGGSRGEQRSAPPYKKGGRSPPFWKLRARAYF